MLFGADRFLPCADPGAVVGIFVPYKTQTEMCHWYRTKEWDYLRGDETMWAALVLLEKGTLRPLSLSLALPFHFPPWDYAVRNYFWPEVNTYILNLSASGTRTNNLLLTQWEAGC